MEVLIDGSLEDGPTKGLIEALIKGQLGDGQMERRFEEWTKD